MNNHIRHTSGRIRIKNKNFRSNASLISLLRGKLHEREGVLETRYNKHAGSITIYYNPATQNGDDLLDCINQFECLGCYKLDCQKPLSERSSPIKTSGTAIASRAGQMAFGMLLEKGVRYSMKSVLGV